MQNFAGNFIAAYNAGQETRRNRLLEQAQQSAAAAFGRGDYAGATNALMPYDLGAAIRMGEYGQMQRDRSARQNIGGAIAAGNMDQARAMASKAGNFDLLGQIQQMGQADQQQALRRIGGLAVGAQSLLGVPMEQRAAAAAQMLPQLADAYGIDPESIDLAGLDVSDAALQRMVQMGMSAPEIFQQQRQQQIGEAVAGAFAPGGGGYRSLPGALARLDPESAMNLGGALYQNQEANRRAIANRAPQDSYRFLTPEEVRQRNLPPGAYQINQRNNQVSPMAGQAQTGALGGPEQRARAQASLQQVIEGVNLMERMETDGYNLGEDFIARQFDGETGETTPFSRFIGGQDYRMYNSAFAAIESGIPAIGGAAITPQERQVIAGAMLPTPQDSPAERTLKQRRRQQFANGIARMAGQPEPYPNVSAMDADGLMSLAYPDRETLQNTEVNLQDLVPR